jgi:hypothetical protein
VTFAAAQSLQNMMQPMDPGAISADIPVSKRRRPALSCVGCRRRKVKCDRNDPCTPCKTTHAQCTYKACSKVGVSEQQAYTTTLPNSLGVLDPPTLQGFSATAAVVPSSSSSTLDGNTILSPNHTGNAQPQLQHLLLRIKNLEDSRASSSFHDLYETSQKMLARQFELEDPHIPLNKTRILRWSHWMGKAREVHF